MSVWPLLELCDHDHKLLDYRTMACAVDYHCIPCNAVRIIEMSCGRSMREWKQTWMYLRWKKVNQQQCDVYKTWKVWPSYFIIHSPLTCDTPTYTKLEWLVHHISLFTVCAHMTLQSTYTSTTTKCGACSGSPQLESYELLPLLSLLCWGIVGKLWKCLQVHLTQKA